MVMSSIRAASSLTFASLCCLVLPSTTAIDIGVSGLAGSSGLRGQHPSDLNARDRGTAFHQELIGFDARQDIPPVARTLSEAEDDSNNATSPEISQELIDEIQAKVGVEDIINFILDIVKDAEENDDEPPEIAVMLEQLSVHFGYEADVMEPYLNVFPHLGQQILDTYENATLAANERKVQSFVDLFLDELASKLKHGKSLAAILESLGLEEKDLDEALEALNHPDVVQMLESAQEEGVNSLIERFKQQIGDGSSTSGRHRRLVEEEEEAAREVEALEAEYEQRRLRREQVLKQTLALEKRLTDHASFIQHHARRLQAVCSTGDGMDLCNAKELQQLADQVSSKSLALSSAVGPVTSLIASFGTAEDKLKNIKTLSITIYALVLVASKIPSFGSAFKAVEAAMKKIKKPISDSADKAKKTEDDVFNPWQNSIGKLTNLLDTLETTSTTAAGTAFFLLEIKESQCLADVVSSLFGTNIDSMQSAINDFMFFSKNLVGKLDHLTDSLESNPWNGIQNALNTLINGMQPLFDFFDPFMGLADLLNRDIVIKPWIALPYGKDRLDPITTWPFRKGADCQPAWKVGYNSYKGGLGRTCYESDSADWITKPGTLGTRIQKRCHLGGMGTDIFGNCFNSHRGRKFAEWWKCPDGNYPKYCLDWCYKWCPHGFETRCGDYCFPEHRMKYEHPVSCAAYESPGVRAELGALGGCYRGCNHGDYDWGAICVPQAELRINIKKILEEVSKILGAIEDIPIIGDIYKGINDAVSVVMEPITSEITEWLQKANILPPFLPDFSVELLPFGALENVQFPPLPDISSKLNFADTALQRILQGMEMPFNIQGCGVDIDCIMKEFGVDTLDDMISSLTSTFDATKLAQVEDTLKALLPGLECKKWVEKKVPVSKLLEKAIGQACTSCDMDVPHCEKWEFTNFEQIKTLMNGLAPVFDPVAQALNARRILQEAPDPSSSPSAVPSLSPTSTPSISPSVYPSAAPSPPPFTPNTPEEEKYRSFMTILQIGPLEGVTKGSFTARGGPSKKVVVKAAKPERYDANVQGHFVSLTPKFFVGLGYNTIDGMALDGKDFGFQVSFEVELEFSNTGGINALLQERIHWKDYQRDTTVRKADNVYGMGWATCWTEKNKGANSRGDTTYNVDASISEHDKKKCSYLEDAKYLIELREPGCEDEMKAWHSNREMFTNPSKRAAALKCIKHWHKTQKAIDKKMAKFEKMESYYSVKNYKENGGKNDVSIAMLDVWKNSLWPVINPLEMYIDSAWICTKLGIRRAKRKLFTARLYRSPQKYMEPGASISWDHDSETNKPTLYDVSVGRFTLNSLIKWRKEKSDLAKEAQVEVFSKKEGKEVLVTRTPQAVTTFTLTVHSYCAFDFNPYEGNVRGTTTHLLGFDIP